MDKEELINKQDTDQKQDKFGQILFAIIVFVLVATNIRLTFTVSQLSTRVDNIFAHVVETGNPIQPGNLPPISSENSAIRGNPAAPVQIVEFSDFTCPYCAQNVPVLEALFEQYGSQISVVYRHFPLSRDYTALLAAEAAECAGEQEYFWEMHDLLFANQSNLSSDVSMYIQLARELPLDEIEFVACMTDHRTRDKILHDLSEGQMHGVRGTPTFFVNGHAVIGFTSVSRFSLLVDEMLANDLYE